MIILNFGDANSYPFDDRYSEVMSAGVNEQPSVLEPSPVRNIHSGHCAVCTVIHLVKRLKTYGWVVREHLLITKGRRSLDSVWKCLKRKRWSVWNWKVEHKGQSKMLFGWEKGGLPLTTPNWLGAVSKAKALPVEVELTVSWYDSSTPGRD